MSSSRLTFSPALGALALGVLALSAGCPDPHHSKPEVDSGMNPIETDAGVDPEKDAGEDPDPEMDAGTEDAGMDAGNDDRDGGWPLAPLLRNPVHMHDLDLAKEALRIMGSADVGAEGSCRDCHSLGRPTLSKWKRLTKEVQVDCLKNTSLSDPNSIDTIFSCLRQDKWGKGIITPTRLGIFSAAAHLPWFEFAYEHASDAGENWQNAHEEFVGQVGMPREGERFTQAEFDVVAEWFLRGLPRMRDIVPPDPGTPCNASIGPKLLAHVDAMKTGGWRAKNAENGLLMYGCQAGDTALTCLSEHELAKNTTYGAKWDVTGASIRVLRDNSASKTLFWSRTSADGRYVGSGAGGDWFPGEDEDDFPEDDFAGDEPVPIDDGDDVDAGGGGGGGGGESLGGQLVDLARDTVIPMEGMYDSGFFPDNSGFMIQAPGGALVCEQSLLSSNPAQITGEESECRYFTIAQIGIYEMVGKSVGGADYWAAAGYFSADDGGFQPTLSNPSADFTNDSEVNLTAMLNEGTHFTAGQPATFVTPDQGDPMLSPSGQLLITRVKGDESEEENEWGEFITKQDGYAIHKVTATHGKDGLEASVEPIAKVCAEGGKPMVSYDERWMVIHHYIEEGDAQELGFSGPSDPEFVPFLSEGGANLVLVDLKTGQAKRITNVLPGQYALFPHFRSDGWIYFVVRTITGQEYFAASDAALKGEAVP